MNTKIITTEQYKKIKELPNILRGMKKVGKGLETRIKHKLTYEK